MTNAERIRGSTDDLAQSPDFNLLFLIAAILLITTIACQNWLFDPLGSIDAFKYVGLFLNYDTAMNFAGDDYKISRLAWVLPGFAFYRLFSPLVGHYALQLTFIVGCVS